MDILIQELLKTSPILAVSAWFMYYQRKDYKELVQTTQEQNSNREEKYQDTIKGLTDSLQVVGGIQQDLKEVKSYIYKK